MRNKISYLSAITLLIAGCANAPKGYAVFEYEDFGPQSMAWETIGMQWWQWNNHGGSRPDNKYDIKVVVYRNIPLEQIKTLFPVDKSKKNDFRYLEYHDSIEYLDEQMHALEDISEAWAINLKDLLEHTKGLIKRELD
jgi:hypothetical protein